VKFGPDGGTISGAGNVSTTGTTSPQEAVLTIAASMGIPSSTILAVEQGMGLSATDLLTPGNEVLGAIAGGLIANPNATPQELAAGAGATTAQQTAMEGTAQVQSGTSAGWFETIGGDILMAAFPFIMYGASAVIFLVFCVIGVIGIVKSPVATGAVQGASAGAGFAALAG
jgi:hypothetical protein